MATIKQIKQTLEADESLRLVTRTFAEVSANRLKQIRTVIERNRAFFSEIAGIYHIVKTEALERKILEKNKKNGAVSILISSNHRFSGALENQLFLLYVSHTPEFTTKRIVIGKTGQKFLKDSHYWAEFDNMETVSDIPNKEELQKLSEEVRKYERIFVYFPKFKTILSQQPNFMDLTGSIEPAPQKDFKSFYYIFEPEIEKMYAFFDNQIVSLLLEQAFLEAELARTAARLISMEQAQRNAETVIKNDRRLLAISQRSLKNRGLLERITSLVILNRGMTE
ncbi:MAG: FoF1 ATP synthase subunit gamma [bacterium]|nr:FoF1 ATP synthase subunit gamma [bacterium]